MLIPSCCSPPAHHRRPSAGPGLPAGPVPARGGACPPSWSGGGGRRRKGGQALRGGVARLRRIWLYSPMQLGRVWGATSPSASALASLFTLSSFCASNDSTEATMHRLISQAGWDRCNVSIYGICQGMSGQHLHQPCLAGKVKTLSLSLSSPTHFAPCP